MPSTSTTRDASRRVEQLLADLAAATDPVARHKAEELARTLVELYGAGLERILAVLAAEPGGEALIRRIAADGLVGSLLVLHDLHPVPVEQRVRAALDSVRPHLGSRVAEFLGIDEHGVARIALRGGGAGCASSTDGVTGAIERAVESAAPELTGVGIEAERAEPALLQIQPFGTRS